MTKNLYEVPEFELVKLEDTDVITASLDGPGEDHAGGEVCLMVNS